MDSNNKPDGLPKIDDTSVSSSPQASSGSSAQDQPDGGNQAPAKPTTANIPVPDEAADSDLIEKEWVERAKQIVEHTKSDPHEQQRAITQMKADYLKKRYDKDINSPSE